MADQGPLPISPPIPPDETGTPPAQLPLEPARPKAPAAVFAPITVDQTPQAGWVYGWAPPVDARGPGQPATRWWVGLSEDEIYLSGLGKPGLPPPETPPFAMGPPTPPTPPIEPLPPPYSPPPYWPPPSLAPPINAIAPAIAPTSGIILGTVLTSTVGSWTGGPSPIFAQQWLRDGVAIAGATAGSYTVSVADDGAMLSCLVTGTNSDGSTSAVSNSVGPAVTAVPVNTAAPVLSPSLGLELGTIVLVSTGAWTSSPSTFRYQWRRAGGNIAGQTAPSYTIAAADHGIAINCRVWASNGMGESSTFAASAGTATLNLLPVNTVLPVTSGSTVVGQTLTTGTGTWTNAASVFAYQWQRDGTNIVGATAPTYLLVSADLAAMLSCVVTASNAVGAGTSVTSLAIGPITATGGQFDFSVPANSGLLIPLGVL